MATEQSLTDLAGEIERRLERIGRSSTRLGVNQTAVTDLGWLIMENGKDVLAALRSAPQAGPTTAWAEYMRGWCDAVNLMSDPNQPADDVARLRAALSKAFEEPIHVEPREFLEKVLAGMFGRQPDMSGDQRKRLNSRELHAVQDVTAALMDTFAALTTPVTPREGVEEEREAFRWIEEECLDLRCVDLPTGGGDADVGWEVISHHMAAPRERKIGFGFSPLEAIADARARSRQEPTA